MDKVPILKINNLLIISLQGDLTDKTVINLQNDILEKIYSTKAQGVLIDISVLDIVDSFLGRVISDTAKMIKLLGAETVLVGMKPNVAITLVELGLELGSVITALDIETGIDRLNMGIRTRDIDEVDEADILGEERDDGI